MKGILCVSLLILLMPSVACAAALPGDSADGKRLHDANCMGCHDTGIYTRKDRLVGSLDALQKRLGDCSHMAKKEFSAIETQNIITPSGRSGSGWKADMPDRPVRCPLMTNSGHWHFRIA